MDGASIPNARIRCYRCATSKPNLDAAKTKIPFKFNLNFIYSHRWRLSVCVGVWCAGGEEGERVVCRIRDDIDAKKRRFAAHVYRFNLKLETR